MIAIDTNILVYAHRPDSPFHDRASQAVRMLAEGTKQWAIPWPCVHEFFGVVTRQIYMPPTPLEIALGQIDKWLESPTVTLIAEFTDYWPLLRKTLLDSKVAGARVHDARIAALCQQHGVEELWSADRDFSRFAGISVRNPLVG